MGKHEQNWVRKNYRDSWQEVEKDEAGEANRGRKQKAFYVMSNLALILRAMRASKVF